MGPGPERMRLKTHERNQVPTNLCWRFNALISAACAERKAHHFAMGDRTDIFENNRL